MRVGSWAYALPARLRAFVLPRRADTDLEEELSFHLAMQTHVYTEDGMNGVEADRRARRDMGGVVHTKERVRDARPLLGLRELIRDMRYASRSLLHAPGFTIVAVATLALGIGANTAMFSVANTFMFRPLPYPQPDQLVRVFRTSIYSQSWPHSAANFLDYRQRNDVFTKIVAVNFPRQSLVEEGQAPEAIQAMAVTPDFFPALGIQPLLGRVFTDEDDTPATGRVAVISHAFWRRLGGDPSILQRTLRLENDDVRVVGVMPAAFDMPLLWGPIDVWRPIAFTPEQRANRDANYLQAFARLKPGVTIGQAQSAMQKLAANLSQETRRNAAESIRLEPLHIMTSSDPRRGVMWFTWGLAGFVMLIACANLADLQLVRTAARTRERSIRAALGAGRFRLLRQSLTESLLIAVLGGAGSLLLARGIVTFIGRRLFVDVPGATVSMDLVVFSFALLCAVLTGLLFGAVPAWTAGNADVNQALKEGARGTTSGQHQRLRHALVVGQVAFALVLLAGAGLFLRGLQRFGERDPGWQVDGLLTAQFSLRGPNFTTPEQRFAFFNRFEERLRAIPGVRDVGLSMSLPFTNMNSSGSILIEGQPDPGQGHWPEAYIEPVSLHYFEAMGIRLLEGRTFTSSDTASSPAVIVINDDMARRFWPNESALGKTIRRPGGGQTTMEIVGVVRDVGFPASLLERYTRLEVFRPMAQQSVPAVSIALRSSLAPELLTDPLRRAAAELMPISPVARIRTARAAVDAGLGSVSLLGALLNAFAGLGLLLAAIGIYGVTSYSVAQRTGELGIRLALGATRGHVRWLVLRRGVGLISAGAAVGLAGALVVSNLLMRAIPMLPTRDPLTLAGLTLTLIGVAIVACYVPAARASRMDPLAALRHE